LCHDKAKTLFYAYLVPKNSIRFDRKQIELDELFFDEPICPLCMSLEYQASTSTFSMEHKQSNKYKDILSDDLEKSSNEEGSQLFRNLSNVLYIQNWKKWLLGFLSFR
jgi:hypothetical protein